MNSKFLHFLLILITFLILAILLLPKTNEKNFSKTQDIVYTQISTQQQILQPQNKTNITQKIVIEQNTPKEENSIKTPKTTYIDWTAWRKNNFKYIRGHLLGIADRTVGWGISAVIDKNQNLTKVYSYRIPSDSITFDKTKKEWWLKANKKFYIYSASSKTLYEAFYNKSIRLSPQNLEEMMKFVSFGKRIYGITDANGNYSTSCSTQINNHWACWLMTMDAEINWLQKAVNYHSKDFIFPKDSQRQSVFIGDVYLIAGNALPEKLSIVHNPYSFKDIEKVVVTAENESNKDN